MPDPQAAQAVKVGFANVQVTPLEKKLQAVTAATSQPDRF
jgi:hypothetical protein